MTTLQKISRVCKAFPDRIACEGDGETLTYGDLYRRAEAATDCLNRQGKEPVILYGKKSVRTVISILACLMAGRAYVPVGGFVPSRRLHKIASQSHATLILGDGPLPGIPGTVCGDLASLDSFKGGAFIAPENRFAYIIYTSGSTGEPKGVPISYENLDHFTDWITCLEPLRGFQAVNVLNQADFSFDLSVADLYYALCGGHRLLLSGEAEDIYRDFGGWARSCVAVVTPTCLRLCLHQDWFNASECPMLRCVFLCGEPLPPETVKKLFNVFPDISVINAYGPTEATCAVSAAVITKEMAERLPLLPVGKAESAAVRIEIESGEIVLKGNSVFGGYLNGASGGYFRQGDVNCYRTGDLGFYEDGWLFCRGRKDRQIKYKGYRIELDEIELQIDRMEGVDACAVTVKRDSAGAVTMIKAVYTGTAQPERIKEALRRELPGYMVPKLIRRADSLPVNANGKLDRKALNEE